MNIVIFDGKSYECARAVKGADYIKLYDENDVLIIAFYEISDLSAFTLQQGSWEPGRSTETVFGSAGVVSIADSDLYYPDITLDTPTTLETGLTIIFQMPEDVNCLEQVKIDNKKGSVMTISLLDAHGAHLPSNAFAAGACVKMVLDRENSCAFAQNADTNNYLEQRIETVAKESLKMITGSYSGTGSNSKTLSFSQTPKAIIISPIGGTECVFFAAYGQRTGNVLSAMVNGCANGNMSLTWNSTSLSWSCTSGNFLNFSGYSYSYTIFY